MVRIKRYSEKTYFDEYIKSGDRETSWDTSCDRYIIDEDGVRYSVEVTLEPSKLFGPRSVSQDKKQLSPQARTSRIGGGNRGYREQEEAEKRR